MTAHYKVTNTTRQMGAVKGRHKNGFFVSIVRGKPMGPERFMIVEKVTPGILGLQRKGYVSIESVEDIQVEVQKQVNEVEIENKKAMAVREVEAKKAAAKEAMDVKKKVEVKPIAPQPVSSLDKEAMKEAIRAEDERAPKALVSGGEGEDPLSDLEMSVDPDGNPNFVVTAGKKPKSKNKKNRK